MTLRLRILFFRILDLEGHQRSSESILFDLYDDVYDFIFVDVVGQTQIIQQQLEAIS